MDDATIGAKLHRPRQRRCFTGIASRADISAIRGFATQQLATLGAGANTVDRGALVIAELCTNSLMHGYAAERGYMRVEISCRRNGHQIVFVDRAKAFDPTTMPAADITGDIHERPVGGLGLHLVRELAREIRYRRVTDENQTTAVL